jgi:hypothetical protein
MLVPENLCKDFVELLSAQHAETGIINLLRFISQMSCHVMPAGNMHKN